VLLALAYVSLHRILELVVWYRRSELDKVFTYLNEGVAKKSCPYPEPLVDSMTDQGRRR
jgi:hypothetical protein